MRGEVAVVVLLCLGLSGCLETAAPAQAVTFEMGIQALPYETLPATLEEPPSWRTGEWWRLRIERPNAGVSFECTRVVVGRLGDDYIVGFVPSDWPHIDDYMAGHLPGLGPIGADELSFPVHDPMFAPVSFPLHVGSKWDTTFEGLPLHAEVVSVDDAVTARIRYQGAFPGNGTYDARLGELAELAMDDFATVSIVDHGFGYEGRVVWPSGHDTLWENFGRGRWAGVFETATKISPPFETLHINDTFDRLSFNFAIGSGSWPAEAPGYYRVRATAPDGTVYEDQIEPSDGATFRFPFFGHPKPGGDWRLEYYAAGFGVAAIEAVGYQLFEADLKTGAVSRVVAPSGFPERP